MSKIERRKTHERSLEEKERDLRLISELVSDIKAHNEEHGWGAIAGKTLGRVISSEDENVNPNEVQKEVRMESSSSTHVGLTALRARHEETLKHFGLALQHEPSEQEDQGTSGKVLLVVTDADKLISCIKGLKPLIENSPTPTFLDLLLENIEKQVYLAAVNGISPQDQEIFSRLPEISSVFGTISLTTNRRKIDAYAQFNRDGRLENYAAVEREGLWNEPGENFGPADWVKDITPDGLEKGWQHALDIVRTQEANQESGVAPELQDHLLRCIASAAETLKTLKWPEETKAKMQEILSKYARELRGNAALN